MKGTLQQFDTIVAEMVKNTKAYDEKRIKHLQWVEQIENIFASYTWTKKEFYRELNARLGIQTNDDIRDAKAALEKAKPKQIKKRAAK